MQLTENREAWASVTWIRTPICTSFAGGPSVPMYICYSSTITASTFTLKSGLADKLHVHLMITWVTTDKIHKTSTPLFKVYSKKTRNSNLQGCHKHGIRHVFKAWSPGMPSVALYTSYMPKRATSVEKHHSGRSSPFNSQFEDGPVFSTFHSDNVYKMVMQSICVQQLHK